MFGFGGAETIVISNSIISANIYGASYVGGIIGFNLGNKVKNSYVSGLVSATGTQSGGIAGLSVAGLYENNFWNNSPAGQATLGVGSEAAATGATGVSEAQLKMKDTFTGWDFAQVWKISEGASFPEFKHLNK